MAKGFSPQRPNAEGRLKPAYCLWVGLVLILGAPLAAADHVHETTPIGTVTAHQSGTSASGGAGLGASTAMVPAALPVAGIASMGAGAYASEQGAGVALVPSASVPGVGTVGGSIGASTQIPAVPSAPELPPAPPLPTTPELPPLPEVPAGEPSQIEAFLTWVRSLF